MNADEPRNTAAPSLVIREYQRADAAYQDWDGETVTVADGVSHAIQGRCPSLQIEHIGSTAVPGLGGKGVVDLMVLYPAGMLEEARAAVDGLGFQRQTGRDPFPESRPMRVGAVEWKGKSYRLHVHIVAADDPEVRVTVHFRNRLRRDAALRERYAALKKEILAGGVRDSLDYWRAKSVFFVVNAV